MDVRQLRHFVGIVDLGSMSKAAARWHIAQPALSQQMAALEADLGVQLLVRSTRGVEPTPAGLTLYRHARSLLRQFDDVRRDVKAQQGAISGVVAIGLPTTIAAILALPLLRSVRERYPGIRLQLFESMTGYLSELLVNGRLDFAVLFHSADSPDISVEPVVDEELLLMGILDGATAQEEPVPLSQLAGAQLVLPSGAQELRRLIERVLTSAEVPVNVVAELDSLPTLLGAVAEGLGMTILPHAALACQRATSFIPYRSLSPAVNRRVSLCRMKSTPITPAAKAVYELLLELAAAAIRSGEWKGARLIPKSGRAAVPA
jgi:LysR family transcriptional regulator, nitrogen assimilation regulatory protein